MKIILKGDVCYQTCPQSFVAVKSGYLVVTDGKISKVSRDFPAEYKDYELIDYSGKLIVPGLIDLHMHASQNGFRGTCMDDELIDWLNGSAFTEEAKFSNFGYADKAYTVFTDELVKSATTRAVIFGTLHKDATLLLMDKLEKSGLVAYVGKVNMDRNCPEYLCEKDIDKAQSDTIDFLNSAKRFTNVYPILTPRFTPACSDEMFARLEKLQCKYNVPVQSHLSENLDEISLVKSLRPNCDCYGKTYDDYGLFGKNKKGESYKTVMAHCVWSEKVERDLMKKNGVFIAHSPLSNLNLSSGIAPVRTFLDEGLKVALATDVAGGNTKSMFSVIVACVQVSKMYWRLVDEKRKPITFAEAFYMATKVGGEFFGNVGTFSQGYDADILVLDDKSFAPLDDAMPIEKRLERFAYLNGDLRQGGIAAKFVRGEKVV